MTGPGRPPLTVGTYGAITPTKRPDGRWRVRISYRGWDGVRRRTEVTRKTRTACVEDGRSQVKELITVSSAGEAWTPDMFFSDAADLWLEGQSAGSKKSYGSILSKHLVPAFGQVRLREMRTPQIQAYLLTKTHSIAKSSQSILRGVLGEAHRLGLLETNQASGLKLPAKAAKTEASRYQNITPEDIDLYRQAIYHYAGQTYRGVEPAEKHRYGGDGLPELVDFFLGTGTRIGEALALRWEDVDWESETVSITGHMVDNQRIPGSKTTSRTRVVSMTAEVESALKRQQKKPISVKTGIVFPGRGGVFRTTNNTLNSLRRARPEGSPITPHTFRHIIATMIAAEDGDAAAAAQLGHASENMVRSTYKIRQQRGPDMKGKSISDSLH